MNINQFQNLLNKMIDKGLNKAKSVRNTRKLFKKWLNIESSKEDTFIYFSTFTFNNEKLENFNRASFVKYLRRNKINAILYADYGKENGRFHLHGFISVSEELKKRKDYFNKWGHTKFIKAENFKMIEYCVKYSTKFEKSSFRTIITNGRK